MKDMKDMIYRQAAIDALGEEPEVWTGKDEYAQGLNNQWHYDVNALKALPSAQQETARDTNVLDNDTISRQAAIAVADYTDCTGLAIEDVKKVTDKVVKGLKQLPSAQPEQRWIPVTFETLPNPNSVVVVCGKKGTWDYGTYRGWYGDIHSWQWKKKTIKHVYWWMYKTDALPEPYREEGEQE